MDFLECQDFLISSGNIFYPVKEESIDEELNSVINPDDFFNSDFFKTENETTTIARSNSESNSENFSCTQLTPPISPITNTLILPGTKIHNRQRQSGNEKKIKPILPAKTKTQGSSDSDSNNNPSNLDKAQLKLARLIRNRESAIQSRRKKKEYLQNLEVEVNDLKKEVRKLKEENYHLKEKLLAYSSLTCRCASSISSKISSPKSTSLMMFALLLMIGFNAFSFIPLSSYLARGRIYNDGRKTSSLTSRHLLFVENNATVDSSSSENTENEFLPFMSSHHLNQTDRIRKANIENVLNWIPQPEDLFNLTNNFDGKNDKKFKNFDDPLQYKFAQMYEKSRKVLEKGSKKKSFKKGSAKKKQNASSDYHQNLYNPDLFKFHEFFDEIKRKDDTFYVLSFRENFLLPAIENFSQMIKMNLIMPRNNETLSSSNKIMMMQFETILINSSLIEVDEKSIPIGLVKGSSSNSTVMCNQQKMSNNSTETLNYVNVTKNIGQAFKRRQFPYFHFDLDQVDPQK